MLNPEHLKGLRRGDVKDGNSVSSLYSSTVASGKNGHITMSSSGEESHVNSLQESQKPPSDSNDNSKGGGDVSPEGCQQMTKEPDANACRTEKLPRGGSSGVSEEGLNISDLECVWETANGTVDLPPTAALASVETLSTTSSNAPRSFTTSSQHLPFTANSQSHTPSASTAITSSVPHPGLDSSTGSVEGVKRSLSLADASALSSNASKRKGGPYHHQKSPSYGSVPKDMCPLNSRHERVIDMHGRPSQTVVVAFRSQSLHEGQQESEKVLVTSMSSPSEDIREQSLEDESVRHSQKSSSCSFSSGIGEPSVYHALVVIFLEFFAWGLLTSPMIMVLKTTFPDHTFLMNGIIMGIKGLLSFLSAPLIGALSDVWGRKFFLFITVFFTCLPIPFMKINTWWYFALISMSGVFAVTYSIVFAYVADVTDPAERHHAYGLVSATFAASLVMSPALGAYLSTVHSDDLVVGLATAIAVLDIFFILVAVPESLPEKLRISSTSTWSTQISWEQADPFSTLWKVSKDKNILLISVTVFLSYLPEAGQLSCFFVYLQLVMGFGPEMVATFIAVVGIMSVVAQTALLGLLIRTLSNKRVISVGLVFELLQLMWYGFGSQTWMIWAAGILAAISSITYPAISAYISTHTDIDKQGVVQGIVTGMRGLCSGLGPAVFGFIFYLFHVDLNQSAEQNYNSLPGGGVGGVGSGGGNGSNNNNSSLTQGHHIPQISSQVPGPPFVFGAMLVLLALTVSAFIPEGGPSKNRKQSASALDLGYGRDHKKSDSLDGTSQPLMNESGVL